ALNTLQKFLVEETRLGIPAMSHEECLVGLLAKGATLFPSALNYGSTWNPELIEAVGCEIRKEAKQVGSRSRGSLKKEKKKLASNSRWVYEWRRWTRRSSFADARLELGKSRSSAG
ncbi:MAG TPA: glycoside hydrolase family 3 N-terminal domain-containing protein, partial [Burkholderiales bacterium]|nr:glycoside hydrolase family 3 N-terminal domain-containing protein [Burkholderiales bacterium]